MHDPQALAETETHLIHVLEHSDPPRDASRFNVTAAALELHDRTGGWTVRDADTRTVEDVLARHAKD
ncbi:hypothetical protein GCM10011374_00120 [Kocuria dechangensis]|jgi:hypothetical protein|uniref:Uncharacterized protein n=1 Tax=Kocuria dechangensis TaxID=1176249 RepID=A0A917GE79_9MICC|nr:hypothetical protein [Kocuria dechangensis]GGG41751.1 hypothetical protein GCM10011374_00120 [Kocuria dechangensis]